MEITGRLTADATVKPLKGERNVVNFSIAVNDSYRSGGETKKVTTYFDCSYWLNSGIAEYLKKGGLVQLYGRVGVNAYISGSGEAKASLTFHTSEVKLLGGSAERGTSAREVQNSGKAAEVSENSTFDGLDKDLPF